jgi:threonine dehydratase
VGEHREAVLAVTIPERRGSFRRFLDALGGRNVTEFNYRMSGSAQAHIFVGVSVHGRDETARIARRLERAGCRTLDLSDNETAKEHVRHMVGGRAGGENHAGRGKDELLYRFEFPERQGALMRFLRTMNPSWNISLFHYRNLGADYGNVLVGIQVPKREMGQFRAFLARLGYPHVDETRNPAYRLFLG